MVLDQAPPSNQEAETTVVASILVDAEALSRVAAFLQPEDFFEDRHVGMYRAALALDERREAINQVTLAHELSRMGKLEEAGGHAYLSQIIADLPTTVGVEYSAKIVQRGRHLPAPDRGRRHDRPHRLRGRPQPGPSAQPRRGHAPGPPRRRPARVHPAP